MHPNPSLQSRRTGLRLVSRARALLAVSALAALAVSTRSLAQVPTFNALVQTPVTVGSGFPEDAAVGDINGDGKLDVMIPGINGLRMMLGNGNGTFVDQVLGLTDVTTSNVVNLHPSLTSYLPRPVGGIGGLGGGIKAVDVNRDGKLDLVGVTSVGINFTNYSFVSVLINSGVNDANGVPLFTTTHHWIPFLGVRPVTVGDLNGDNWPDFIIGTCCNGIQVWTSNGGSGTFTPGQVFSLTPGAGGPSVGQGVITDLNGDGKADYVVSSNQNAGANIFFGNGNGTFQTPGTYLPNGAVSVAVADVNGDGRPDLLMGNTVVGSEGLYVYLNNGGGAFGAPTLYAIASFSSSWNGGASVTAADINGDGKLDAVLTNTNSNSIAVLLGNGTGGFGTQFTYSAATFPTNGVVGDFNGDGKADIGFVLRNSRSYGVLTNTTVPPPPPLPTQTLTILGGSGTPGTIAPNVEYYNPATGNWQPAYLTGGHPWGFATGTNSWINYKTNTTSDSGAGPTPNQTLWYLYRVRFTVPLDAMDPHMTFAINADNFAQVAINGVTSGGSTQIINNANVNNVIVGGLNHGNVQFNADAVFSQNVHPGENTITLNIGDWGGLNGFNFRIDLSMKSAQPLEIVPTAQPPVVASGSASGTYGTAFTYNISATNSPTSYNATGLPTGLSVNTSSGAISGTPTQTGSFTVNLSATNAGGTGNGTLALTINKKSATVTLGDLAQTYDGTAKSVTASTSNPSGLPVVINYLGDRTNAGNCPVQAIIDSPNYTGSANDTLVIAKANATVSVSGYTGTYDGAAHGATGSATGVGGANLSANLSLGATFTNAPGGTANWTFAGGANYHNASGSVAITINKANATVVVTPYNVEYDGLPHSATVASITGVAGETGATVGTVALNTTHTAVGTYADSWSFTGGTNYHNTSGTLTDVIKDTTAPTITSLSTNAPTLWPPNHKMVAVTVSAAADDLVGVTSLKIVSATSNEPDNGLGDGDTAGDIQITGALTLNLRAERGGGGNGRIYTITVEAKDAAGNASTKTVTVTVPKSQGGK
jgi:hypothetical protein